MSLRQIVLLAVSLAIVIPAISGHTYKTGGCPSVEPMSGFDMKKFLGVWYAVQKTSTASSCVVYNITRGEEPGEYNIEQTSQHFALEVTPVKHIYSYTGELSIPDNDVPAKMRVKYPLSVAGTASFVVFMTDYDQFAGIFTCQKIPFAHRESATILSRSKDMDKLYLDKIRNRLSSYGVNPFSLSNINQTGCPKPGDEGYDIHIDPNTFSASNIASVVRKAGTKLGDGIEYAVNKTKQLYRKVTANGDETTVSGDYEAETVLADKTSGRSANTRNVEWLPL